MVIDIIGAGAIGLLFGSKLIQAGYKVRFWCRTTEQAEHLAKQGVKLSEQLSSNTNHETVLFAEAYRFQKNELYCTNAKKLQPQYTIIAVKQSQLDDYFIELVKQYISVYPNTTLIMLQNGLGHMDKLQAVMPGKAIIQAVTSEGAYRQTYSNVLHTGKGKTFLSVSDQNMTLNTKLLKEALDKAGILVEMSKNIKSHVYFKLLINAVINPLTALFHVKNGELPEDERRLQIMLQLFQETKAILTQYEPSVQDVSFQQILEVCEKTYSNYSSMLVDIMAGRVTEIQAINGAVVTMAEQYNLTAPLNEALLHLIEARHP